jgi:hypothetical protein
VLALAGRRFTGLVMNSSQLAQGRSDSRAELVIGG